MAQYLPLPDGSYLKLQEGESPEAGFRRAQQKYPEAFAAAKPQAQPESGFMPALRAGATELGGGISALMGRTGLKDQAKAQAEYDAAQKRAKEIFKPTEEGWTEAPFTKFGELLGGSLPYMAAPVVAGAAAAALPVTGTTAAVLGLGAAGLTSAGQFTATNLGRQMEEGKKLEETDLGAAALAAVPQAALDTLSMRMIPGIGRMFGKAGIPVTKETAKEIAEQGLKRTLVDYAVNTGKTAGIEGLTESAQQVFERLQAGLSLTDEKARQEYFDNFLGGAILGGTLSVPGRYMERGRAQREARGLLQEEAQKQQAEQRKAEETKRQSPEYLLDLEQRYKAALIKKQELDAAAKPPKKEDAVDPAVKIAHREAVRARDEFAKTEMAAIAQEYAPRKKEIEALNAQRQQEIEIAAAKEVPQVEQKLPYYASAQATIPGLEPAEAPAPEATETVDYAAQARNLRGYLDDLRERAQNTTDLDAKLSLGEEYARVQAALKNAEDLAKKEGQGAEKRIESLRRKMATAEERGDIDAQVNIAKELKALGVTNLGAQEALDLGKPQPLDKLQIPTDLADYRAEQKRVADEAAAREEQKRQQQQLAREAYERSLQTSGLYADVAAAEQRKAADRAAAEAETRAEAERTQREEELVGKLVAATGAVQQQPAPQARVALPTAGTREDTYDAATELRARLAFAQQTRNKTLEANVKRQLDQLGAAPEEARGSALDLGETAREAGVEGALTPEAMEQNRLSRLAQRQLLSYDQLVKHINRAREREQTAVDEKTKAQYKYRAEQLKQAALGFAIQEINGRRQQYGLPVLEQKEVMRAVTGLARPLNELIARGAQMFEEPVVVRGQQRGIRLVEGAQEFERPPAGRRTFPEAGFASAADTLREQFRETVEKISGVPQPAPRPGKPPGPVRKVVPEQRELFLTPPPAEEPVSLAPTALLDKGIDKAVSAEDARLLRQMQEVYTRLTPEQQSVVREQGQRAADGKPLDAVYEMRGLYQLQQRETATAAGQQTFLKPITLVTARRKIEQLAKQAAALEKEVREKLEPLIRGGVTRGLPELDYATKVAQTKAFAEKVAAGKKTDVERAQAAFDRAREQGKDLIDTAQQIRNTRATELTRFSKYVYTPLLEKQRQLDSAWNEATAEFTQYSFEYDDIRAAFDSGRAPKTNRAELEALSRLIPQTAARVVKTSKQLDDINNRVIEAERVLREIRERQAADTVTNSLLKEATKARNKINTAQQKLVAAREAEKAAERAHTAVIGEVERAPTLLEQIEALPIEGVTRVFRDTNDPAVQAQATKKRSAIAREEGTYASLEERLKKAEDKDKVALQRQLNESKERLQNLHNELYDVYNNAPLKRVQGKTSEAAASAERLEKARHEVHDVEIEAFNAQHNTARLSLPPRKAGPLIKNKGAVAQAGEKVVKAEPETPIADIAKTRLRLAEIAQQLEYIKNNKAISKEGKAKQAKAKKALAKEKTTLSDSLRGLLKQQTLVKKEEEKVKKELKEARTESRAAIRRGKLEATDAQLFEDLAKATKTQEQVLLFERAENAFGAMAATEQAFVRKQANAVVGRREADYKGEALADIVAAAERRMAREAVEPTLPARGVEVESPALTAAQISELENNDVAQALALLATDKGADPVHRAVAQRLAQLLDKTNVEVADTLTDEEGNSVLGQALASGKTIRLSRAGGLTQEILLHEGVHAAAERVLMAPESSLTPLQLAAKRELQALHAAIKNDPRITSTDAKGSLSEFVAEVMSNKNLQQQLAKKPWKLSDALKGFKSIILRLLGIKETQSMLGAAMKSVDAIFMPTSVQTFKAEGVRTQYSQKDIAALHDGSNSMRQFAENFPQYIKQKDRTFADVDRIGLEYLEDMNDNPEDYVAPAEPDRLDYKADTIMSDGKVFDPDNPLHLVEATPTTFVALEAQNNADLRKREAQHITDGRLDALVSLINGVLSGSSYTKPEQALVAKAASKYSVQSTPEGRLKLVTIDSNNRHPVAVVSEDAARAIIEELRAGKNLKAAFLDGMQRVADSNAERNKSKNGWQKFETPAGVALSRLYTEQEVNDAFDQTGYDVGVYQGDTLIERLIEDGLLPDRRALIKTARDVEKIEKAAIELNAGAAGTSWCTGASVHTARSQIEQGDFYIYYKDGRPEVAVRMNGQDEIEEIRGNTPRQWLTPEQQKIAEAFLRGKRFKGSDRFIEETERKAQIVRLLKGEARRGDSFVFAFALNKDQSAIDADKLYDVFRFDTLDGYASRMRPEPSEKVIKDVYQTAMLAVIEDMEHGYIPFNLTFEEDNTASFDFAGRTIDNVQPSEIVHVQGITTPYTNRYAKKSTAVKPLVFSNLKTVSFIHLVGNTPVEFPKLLHAQRIVTISDRDYQVTLSDKAVVDKLYAATDATIHVKGGLYVNVHPISAFASKFKTLTATVDAPYVTVTPYEKYWDSDPETSEAPKATVKTPNKIADAPPVETIIPAEEDRLLFARSNLPKASDVANKIIGKQPSVLEKIKNNGMGLGFRTQFIDGLAPLEQIARTSMDALKGAQMMYYLRMYGMRMNFTSQAISNGALKLNEVTRKDGRKEWLIESEKGANIADIVKVLSRKEVKNAAGGADAANRLFTLYLAAIRGENVGFDRLNFGRAAAEAELKQIERELASTTLSPEDRAQLKRREAYLTQRKNSMPTEQEFRDAKAEIESDPVLKSAFDEARDIYNEYNKGLLRFAEQVGYLSKDEVARLLRNNDYIPYYRVRGGNAQLVIGGETPVRIGNLKDSPHLKELVGGEEPIFNFLDSSVQNTSMLVDAALRNIASKNVAYELHDIGLASLPRRASRSGAPTGALEFKKNGEDYYVTVETETLGVPSDLLVKGMAGIPTQLPSIVRMMGIPARVLRRAVTAAPPYIAKQVFRDSLAAFMSSGSDGAPVLSAVLQIGKESPLTKRGVTGGQVFTGLPEDMSRLLREMQEGRPGWSKAFSKLEALSMEADALTRRSQYDSYLKQGLSEMEATLMSLESMNFSKRGISPSMHWATTLIPFMNAQIQSLDVLYKAFRGHLPFNEQLDIRNKLMARGALMVAATLAYAAAMQDDDAYKNAKPDEKYNNWFVRLPFLDQYAGERVTLRVPIPFEIGYIFKALPEALFNTLVGGKKAQEDAAQAFLRIGQNLIPGGSSFGVPQAVKPLIEVGLGKSFFTGRDLESAKEQQQMPGTRYRDQTTELAKQIGEALNISPIKLEALISGYTGSMGMFLTQMLSLPLPQIEGGKAEKRLSETPLIGSMFQPSDATGIIDNAYKSFQEATQAQASYKAYIERGEFGKAQALMRGKLDELTLTGLAGNFKENMGKLTKAETAIKASNMSPEEKRKALDGIRQAKINLAAAVRAVLDRKEPQAALP